MPTTPPNRLRSGILASIHALPGVVLFSLASVSLAICSLVANAADSEVEKVDLLQLSLEDLGRIKVTTVSRKGETVSHAAAAVYVITQEDIRRSGAASIAEALRMAPGLQVARANSRQWGISARGFNEIFANKLLVLMDGRTLYTPLFSGVFWEETDTVLEDIERIEVVRGPGATLWGANAVNGVVNIITRRARDTQGTLISGGGGIEERGFGTVRYGGSWSTNAHYRIYGKYSNHDEFTQADDTGAKDSWWTAQGGFRVDWEPSEMNRLTLQGDSYSGDIGGQYFLQSFAPPELSLQTIRSKIKGANVLSRWVHEFSSESDLSVQAYYDRTDREFGVGREIRDTLDLDAQHRFHIGDRHEIVWGGAFRHSADEITESADFRMEDPNERVRLFGAFLQDEIALSPDRLHLTLGTKVEQNNFTGWEIQPNGRLAWMAHERHTVWGAVSRAVRTPSRAERDLRVFSDPRPALPPLPFPVVSPGSGSRELGSEELLAYELGYRVQIHRRLTLDCAAFYNDYDHLRSIASLTPEVRTTSGPSPTAYLILPLTFRNDLDADTYGLEISAAWQPLDSWRLRANYTLLRTRSHSRNPDQTFFSDTGGNSPRHQFALFSQADLGRKVEWGIGVRYVDELNALLLRIPAYTELETRLAWKPNRHCELAIIGNNLLHAHHQEFNPVIVFARNVQVDRAIFGKVTVRF
ncbi:MAG: TonB-dependent receptor [Verrucomicrobia bacterium]|nr:TonB-dependent receptor [Verrucomicrobiota bacterium]